MRYTTTDGKEYSFPYMCSCCRMNTAGQHESSCPMYRPTKIITRVDLELLGWLKISESAFNFWDNPEDDKWNDLPSM